MIISEYGREGDKAFKYVELSKEIHNPDDLFSDIVGHCIDHPEYEVEKENIHPESDLWFSMDTGRKEIRVKDEENNLRIDYGINQRSDYSKNYVESVWQDEISPILERNVEEDLEEHHLEKRTMQNISGRAKV